MPEGSRPNRVSEEFREILAEEIPRLKDPRVGFVTVLGVTVTPDLRLARVFYTTLGDDRAHRATAAALASARGHLRKVIGTQVRMKVLPELRFEQEDAREGPDRIEQLLRSDDPVVIARNGPEAVIRRDCAVAEIFDLLKHGVRPSAGVDVARQEEHR